MDLLAAFRVFIRISETGSFSAVAREAGTTQPAVSRQIAALEDHLSARLLQRSTRGLTLTEDGRELLPHARLVVEAVEESEAAVGRGRAAPAGLVHLGCPGVFGRLYVAPRLPRLLERYPQMSIDLAMSDSVVDMVQEGLDLSIRVGDVSDPTLITRRIGVTSAIPVASHEYLSRHPEPQHPSELSHHECILFNRLPNADQWHFVGAEGPMTVRVSGRMRTNDIEAVVEAALGGLGVAMVPTWMLRDSATRHRLRPILTSWQPRRRPIFVVYPSRRFLAPRTRAVIDFLVEEFHVDPIVSPGGETS